MERNQQMQTLNQKINHLHLVGEEVEVLVLVPNQLTTNLLYQLIQEEALILVQSQRIRLKQLPLSQHLVPLQRVVEDLDLVQNQLMQLQLQVIQNHQDLDLVQNQPMQVLVVDLVILFSFFSFFSLFSFVFFW